MGSHMLVSCLSLLNSHGSGSMYPASLIPSYFILVVSVTMAIKLCGASVSSIKEAVMFRPKPSGNVEVNAEQ